MTSPPLATASRSSASHCRNSCLPVSACAGETSAAIIAAPKIQQVDLNGTPNATRPNLNGKTYTVFRLIAGLKSGQGHPPDARDANRLGRGLGQVDDAPMNER